MILPVQVTNAYLNAILADLTNPALAAPTVLAGARSILGVNPITPNLATSYADTGEASFTGYARPAVIVWEPPFNDVDTTPTALSPLQSFRCTTAGTPQQVYNAALTDAVAAPNTGILGACAINPPISVANIGDGCALIWNWNLYLGNGENVCNVIL